jgi:hypothetical protein
MIELVVLIDHWLAEDAVTWSALFEVGQKLMARTFLISFKNIINNFWRSIYFPVFWVVVSLNTLVSQLLESVDQISLLWVV